MKTIEHRAATRLQLCNVIRHAGAILDRLDLIEYTETTYGATPEEDPECITKFLAEAQDAAADLSESAGEVEKTLDRYAHHVAAEKLKGVAQ